MSTILKTGIAIGLVCAAWTYVLGFAGWHTDPKMMGLFYLVIVFEIVGLAVGLKATAKEGRGYGGQLGAGVLMSVVAAVPIFLSSIVFTSLVFPEYFDEIRKAGETMLAAQGLSEEAIKARLDAAAATQTTFMAALIGAIATIVTGFVASLVLAAIFRAKKS